VGGAPGYVRDNYLIVPLVPRGALPLANNGFGIGFIRGFAAAKLAWFDAKGAPCTPGGDAGACLLGTDEGLLGGIVSFRSTLEAFMASRPVTANSVLPRYCAIPEETYRQLLVDPLCRARDMTLDPNKWFKGEQCDALSTGIRFRARAAKPWVVQDNGVKLTYEDFCPDGGAQLERFARCEP
jgi:hypothetical protein